MPGGSRASWTAIGLGLALAWGGLAPRPAAAQGGASRVVGGIVYHNSRAFRIPFNIAEADRARIREVQLFVSSDLGQTWKLAGKVMPDQLAFTFHAERDAEFWFSVRTLDSRNRLYPPDDADVEPNMRVIVDTTPPSLSLATMGRRGDRVKVRWEIADENLSPRSLVIQYRAEGARDWRQVPISEVALIGASEWDAGTAAPLKVRAQVEDKAGNPATTELDIGAGVASARPPGPDQMAGFEPPPPISPIRSASAVPTPGTGYDREAGGFAPPEATDPGGYFGPPDGFRSGSAVSSGGPPAMAGETAPSARISGAGAITGAEPIPDVDPLLVSSARFNLQYAIDGAGPHGPALVELWLSRDGGRTWIPQPEDVDRSSPYPVDLGGEGTYGIWLVVQSASGLGDRPPQPGDRPMQWVVVDTTAPTVQLDPPQVGYGPQLGKVLITWRAADPHLDKRPVLLSYRNADEPGGDWIPFSDRIDNTGRFVWTVPTSAPPRLHIRIDVMDKLGNRANSETTTTGQPVVVDRSRPRGRILGLDPNASENEARR